MSKKAKRRREAAAKPVEPETHVMEIGPFGADSSSAIEIADMYQQEETKMSEVSLAREWLEKVTKGEVDAKIEIGKGIELADMLSTSFNKFFNFSAMTLAALAILIGRVCLVLKELSGEVGFKWMKWADLNIKSLHPRKRERCMSLASRPDCWRYAVLGMERLEMLVQATNNLKGEDPIGDLLKRYHILYTESPETNIAEFKTMVDAALNMEKLRKHEVTADFDLVKGLTEVNVQFDQNLFRKLRETKAAGGTEKGYLEMLHRNRGKPPEMPEDEKKLQTFNSLTVKLTEVSEHYLETKDQKPEELKKIDMDAFNQLLERLEELKGILIQPAGVPSVSTPHEESITVTV